MNCTKPFQIDVDFALHCRVWSYEITWSISAKWCNIDSSIKCIHLQEEKWRKNLQIKTRLPRPNSISLIQYLKMTFTLLHNLSTPMYIIVMYIRRRYKWEEKDYPLKSDVDAGRILHAIAIFLKLPILSIWLSS